MSQYKTSSVAVNVTTTTAVERSPNCSVAEADETVVLQLLAMSACY